MQNSSYEEQKISRVTGFSGYCGVVIDEITEGHCTSHIDLEERHRNPRGIAHGGLIFTLMDTTGGTAAICTGDERRPLVSRCADIHYILPVTGEKMVCRAEVIRAGKQMALVKTDLYDDKEVLCATASFEFFYLKDKDKKTE